jgi:rhodanese-related sulfurtransferase
MNSEEGTVFTLIDVREDAEHYAGYIPGSVHLSRGRLEFNIDKDEFWEEEGLYKPAKDEIIVLYCKKGERSVLAAEALGKLGYKKVYTIIGGWKTWERTYPDEYEKNLEKLGGHEAAPAKSGGC